jgi:hypothetical protein
LGWKVIEATAPAGGWRKGAAVNPAVETCGTEIVILADADVWCDGLADAVNAVKAGAGWAAPHLRVHRLTEEGTEAVIGGKDWRDQPLAQEPYKGILGGGVVVARRESLLEAPLDSRFVGWGQEDEAHALALNALFGKPWRGSADLIHLFHPPQPRLTRRRGSQESWKLRQRYLRCRNDPRAMRALIKEESRVASPDD